MTHTNTRIHMYMCICIHMQNLRWSSSKNQEIFIQTRWVYDQMWFIWFYIIIIHHIKLEDVTEKQTSSLIKA